MRLFRRLRLDESVEREAAVASWARGLGGGVQLIRDAEERSLVKIAGVVQRVRVQPRDAASAFEVTVGDGTGEVRAIWLGRKHIPGLRLGSRLVLEGRLGKDARGRLQLVNPVYELEAAAH